MKKQQTTAGEQVPETNSAVLAKKHIVRRAIEHPHSHLWILAIASLCIAWLLFAWGVGSWIFRQVRVGDTRVSVRTMRHTLPGIIETQTKEYKVSLQAPGADPKTHSLVDMGITVDIAATTDAARKDANGLRSRLLWWKKSAVNLVLKIDDTKFTEFIGTHAKIVKTPVKNTSVELTPEGTIVVSEESAGEETALPGGQGQLLAAVRVLSRQTLNLVDQKVEPDITRESTKLFVDRLNIILNKPVVFSIEANQISAAPNDIAAWLTLAPNREHSYDATVDSTKVEEYISRKSSAYVRLPRDQVEVKQRDGSVSVLVRGQNGVDVTNKADIIQHIHEKLFSDEDIKLEMKVAYTPYKTVSTIAGNKLIEVDTTNKRMYAYENDVLLRTFLISAGAPETPTVTGRFSIYSKIRSQNMTGFNADGSRYFQPNVAYVNYFYRDYAIHGNYWRPLSYFGNVNSSHGCVGIVNSDAEWIYNWAPIGTPVVVHS